MSVVLVVDDEPQIRAIIGYVVESTGREWIGAGSAEEARAVLQERSVELILLDVMLPGASGIDLCEAVRASSSTPVVLLSALGDEEDRIRGLEAGADDYITKPFSPREVGLRIEAILRRHGDTSWSEAEGIRIDSDTGELSFEGSTTLLPAMESRVLEQLLHHYNRTVSFHDLLHNVWNTDESVGGREMVRITVHRLRAHLKAIGVRENLIETVRGTGYRMRQQSSKED
ncbi:Phosphate regulon transcriptional regulatory protein phoB [Arcanobacterium haemolyticum]|uniref:response regulator n=1 Tax=Arcanobacterium haemolyticum TaxID=28264 RepID=UPI000D9AB3D2|nr:response regulator [Arcanobacterium haemolyticum]SPT75902.1 Phosphate regulon transcriptional regulatory protein phoB [Arcanobacterium haemolyticum]